MSVPAHIIELANEVATMGNCLRGQVGAVIYDSTSGVPLSTGYNVQHTPCKSCLGGVTKDTGCTNSLHAEIVALNKLPSLLPARIGVYTTLSPCINCAEGVSKALHGRITNWSYGTIYRDQTGLAYLDSLGISNGHK